MEHNKKSGRGLHDYAHLFLSRKSDKTTNVPLMHSNDNVSAQILRDGSRHSSFSSGAAHESKDSRDSAESKQTIHHKKPYSIALSSFSRSMAHSFFTVNLGRALYNRGLNVAVLNADLSFPSMNFLSSLKIGGIRNNTAPRLDPAQENIQLITVDMDITILNTPWSDEQNPIVGEIIQSSQRADVIFINISQGFSSNAKAFFKASDMVLLISCTDPARLIESYSSVKLIHYIAPEVPIGIILTAGKEEAEKGFAKLQEAAHQFLGKSLSFTGFLPWDSEVVASIKKKAPLSDDSEAGHHMQTIVNTLHTRIIEQHEASEQRPGFTEKLFVTSCQAIL